MCELYVICDMYVKSCMILVVCGSFIETHRGTRQTTGFIWAQYDSATTCGLPLYLCSYKLVGSVIGLPS